MKLFEETKKINESLKALDKKYSLKDDELQEINLTGFRFVFSKFMDIGGYFFKERKPKYLTYKNPNKDVDDNIHAVKVLYCIDGDTFVGIQNGEKKSYRLSAIDTPELGQPWANESKALVETMIDKKIVYVTYFGLDKYGRKVVDCFLDPQKRILINNALIQEGLSHYHNYSGINKFKTHNFLQVLKKQLLYVEADFFSRGRWGNEKPITPTTPRNRF